MRRTIPILFLGLAVATHPAAAQIKSHADTCISGTGKFELDISFCSLAIKSSAYESLSRATLFAHRGRARLELGDHSGAINDFDTALGLNRSSAFAHNERGRAYHKLGDNDRAVADFDAALRLFPQYGVAYRNRGVARLFQQRLEDALEDFNQAVANIGHDPASRILRGITRYLTGDFNAAIPDLSAAVAFAYPYPEAALWIYLADRRAGRNGRLTLAANADDLSDSSWPNALIKAYLGEKPPAFVLKAAQHSRDTIRRRHLTQAYFFLGQLALLNGDFATARKQFEASINLNVTDAIELAGAKLALHLMLR